MDKLNKNKYSILKYIVSIAYWLKRKIITILTAFMIGLSSGMYNDDIMIHDNQYRIEQKEKDKKDPIL